VSPLITTFANAKLHFYGKSTIPDDQGTIYEICVAPGTSDPTQASSFTVLAQWNEAEMPDDAYHEKIVSLPTTDSSIYIAFVKKFTQPGTAIDGDRWLIDDVSISDCATPIPLPTQILSQSVLLSWDNSSGVASAWSVLVLPADADFDYTASPLYTTTNTNFEVSTISSAYGTPVQALQPETSYVYWVRPACGSTWIESAPFTTAPLPSCPHPVLIDFISVTDTTVDLHWDPIGSATSWEIVAFPAGSPAPEGFEGGALISTGTDFTYPGLTPLTCYDFYLRSVCSETESSEWVSCGTKCMHAPQPQCGSVFTDNGGPEGNYPGSENSVTTICPENPGDVVTVTFSEFSTLSGYDGMYVYDGNSSNAPMLASDNGPGWSFLLEEPGAYWGNMLPGPFQSSSPDGCLTFKFLSESWSEGSGWVAQVSCAPPVPFVCVQPSGLTLVSEDNLPAELTWTQPGIGSQWEVLALACEAPEPYFYTTGQLSDTTDYIFDNLQPDTCYKFYVRSVCSEIDKSDWLGPVYLNNEKFHLVAFMDTNGDGIKQYSEPYFDNGNFTMTANDTGTSQEIYANNGQADVMMPDQNASYTLSYNLPPDSAIYSSNATYNNASAPFGSGTQTFYFPITINQSVEDLKAVIADYYTLGVGLGMQYLVHVYFGNDAPAPASGTFTFIKDPSMSITYIGLNGTTETATGFTYDFTNLQPDDYSNSFDVIMTLPNDGSVNIGDLITTSVSITLNANDADPGNNAFDLIQHAVAPYDPNGISESHGEQIAMSTFSEDDYLYYTIHFQNTGTANALNVRLENILDSQLDASSIELVSASDPVTLVRNGNALSWHFYSINLPYESQNEEASHGYATYRLKVNPGFAAGDIIPNTANIYFDTNPAITTNTFNTEFVDELQNPEFGSASFIIYPNPTSGSFLVSLRAQGDTLAKISVTDLLGKEVLVIGANSATEINIDASKLSKGIYLVKIITATKKETVKKLVID
jgi:uncharacterized repeat protein (TIGR01451 family)